MQNKIIIYQNNDIVITLSSSLSDDEVILLQNTIYGAEGIKYIQTGQYIKALNICKPHFFSLYLLGNLIGTYCLSERETQIDNQIITAFYGRYLSINILHQGKGYGSLIKKVAVEHISCQIKKQHLFYSYIEENNIRSANISKKEYFCSMGDIHALIFSRIFPKVKRNITQEANIKSIKKLLLEFYKGYDLLHLSHIGYQKNYFVIKDNNNEILAGVQANTVNWKIINIPGTKGKIIMHLLPYLPLLNRLFNPKKHCFLSLEGLYYKDGHQKELIILIEGLLNRFKMTSALIMLDKISPLNQLFTNNLGILNRISKKVCSLIMVKSYGAVLNTEREVPAYVSSFDLT